MPLEKLGDVKINSLKVSGKYFDWSQDNTRKDAFIAIVHEIGRVLQIPIVTCQIESEVMDTRADDAGQPGNRQLTQRRKLSSPSRPGCATSWNVS
ncbi:MAG: hypothetical protein ABIT36_08215 [Steroidobacteraceae bacterium]